MNKTKLIRGKPVYLHKGGYVDKVPDGCRIKRIVYDETSNTSLIYCTKKSIAIDVLIAIAIFVCCVISIFFVDTRGYDVQYNSVSSYYDGKLYINFYNEPSNDIDLRMYIQSDGILADLLVQAGECIHTVEVPYQDSYDMYVEYPVLWFTRVKVFKVSAYYVDADKSLDEEY